jgi:chorismate mutase-like protein
MSVDDWRRRIDEIDKQLVDLLNERSRCAIEVGKIKHEQKMRIYDPEREREVIRKVCLNNRGPLDDEGIRRLFERIIDECRRIEKSAAAEK